MSKSNKVPLISPSSAKVMGPADAATADEKEAKENTPILRLPEFTPSRFRTWKARVLELKNYLGLSEAAMAIRLKGRLPDQVYDQVVHLTTVDDIITVLEELYAPPSSMVDTDLVSSLCRLQLTEFPSTEQIEAHVMKFLDIESQLLEKELLPSKVMPAYLLASLPATMNSFRQSIETLVDAGKTISTNEMIGRLRIWAAKYKSASPAPTSSVYLTKNKDSSSQYPNWILDSGASRHVCNSRQLFVSFDGTKTMTIFIGDGSSLIATGVGTVSIPEINFELKEVLYCPEFSTNLMSANCLTRAGYHISFYGDAFQVKNKNKKVLLSGKADGGLYKVGYRPVVALAVTTRSKRTHVTTRSNETADIWHQRFCHACENSMREAVNGSVRNGPTSVHSLSNCPACALGKMKAQPHPPANRKTALLELIHTDVCGPLPPSKTGCTYFVTFTDDYSRRTVCYGISSRTEVASKFKIYQQVVEKETGKKVKRVRSDRAREYEFGEFRDHLQVQGIQHELTAPYSPEQNGVSERVNQTLNSNIRAMLIQAKLGEEYWEDALYFATYVKNRTPSSSLDWKTPYERYFGFAPSVSHLRVFGCLAFVQKPVYQRQSKFSPTAQPGILIGYSGGGYLILTKDGHQRVTSKDIRFDEKSFPGSGGVEAPRDTARILVAATSAPNSYKDAVESKDSAKWQAAMQAEYDSLQSMGTWSLVEPPSHRKALDNRWVYAIKTDAEGKVERYKARLVVKGFQQQFGLDYDETYASVTSLRAVRVALSIAASNDMKVEQIDIKSAFLNGVLEDEIYMKQPKGFVAKGNETLVCRLNKSLYGLKQAPAVWYKTLADCLALIGYQSLWSEESIFVLRGPSDQLLAIAVCYVDDMLLMSRDASAIENLKAHLKASFEIYDKGKAQFFLGIKIERQGQHMYLSQEAYIDAKLEEFRMVDCKPVNTPMEAGLNLEKAEKCSPELPFRELLGSLMYAMIATRPDISYAVSYLSRFSNCYDSIHWEAAKRVLRYLKGTRHYQLKLGGALGPSVDCFADADWAEDKDTRRSTTGSLVKLGDGVVTWKSKRQSCVATSTTEAEYYAMFQGVTDAMYVRNLLRELSCPNYQISIACDNQGTLHWASNKRDSNRAKHVDIKYHFIKELVESGEVKVTYCKTEDQMADFLTKPLARIKMSKIVEQLFKCTSG